jgi:hypothetical protein
MRPILIKEHKKMRNKKEVNQFFVKWMVGNWSCYWNLIYTTKLGKEAIRCHISKSKLPHKFYDTIEELCADKDNDIDLKCAKKYWKIPSRNNNAWPKIATMPKDF